MLALLASGVLAATNNAWGKCGESTEPCKVDDGIYHLELPENSSDEIPLVVFLHGAGGNGKTVMGNRRMIEPILKRGYAVMAPRGGKRAGSRFPYLWNFYPQFENMRDDMQFLPKVVEHAANKFNTSKDKVILAGFSAGAFMVTYLACEHPNMFAAYAPVAGGFWRPHPQKCEGPIQLLQTHGWADNTVPLEGRRLGNGQYVQGDIFKTLEIWRHANGCKLMKPDTTNTKGKFWVRKWEKCDSKIPLQFALHQGGHTVPKEWSELMINWFEEIKED